MEHSLSYFWTPLSPYNLAKAENENSVEVILLQSLEYLAYKVSSQKLVVKFTPWIVAQTKTHHSHRLTLQQKKKKKKKKKEAEKKGCFKRNWS